MNISVPRLGESSRPELERHFLALEPEDVRLRFGSMLAAPAIAEYVARIDFERDAVFGVHDEELRLVGVAHVGFTGDLAELGVSVLSGHRGRGIGGALLARASEHARNRFVDRLYMHCLAENTAMMRLARRLEMKICVDAGEADAFLTLPPADPASVTGEFVEQRLALFDYALKAHTASLRQIAATLRGEREMNSGVAPHRIVIVGGGAGGLPLASRLGDKLGRRGSVEITLVDRNPRHLWKPLLHEVAAGRMDADVHGVDYLALAYWHRFRFRQGTVAGLDRKRHELTLDAVYDDDGAVMLPRRILRYDTLIFCVGSVSNDFGVPGVATHTLSLETHEEAERFHRRLLAACVRADSAAAAGKPTGVDIVIIGAGATGVELAAEIRQTTHVHASYGLEHLDSRKDVRLTVIEAAPRILPLLSEHVAEAATGLLRKLDVDVRTGQRVIAVDENGVRTANGALLHADLVVWAAGIMAPQWLTTLDGLETGRGNQLVVTITLQTTRDTDVFAFGDCAACPWPEAGREGALVPPRAQAARQQAMLLVKSMRARLAGKPLPEFHFHDIGSLVSLGEMSAVGSLMGRLIGGSLLIQGLIARCMYASLYKLHQVAILGYLGVALDTAGRFLRRHTEPRVKLH